MPLPSIFSFLLLLVGSVVSEAMAKAVSEEEKEERWPVVAAKGKRKARRAIIEVTDRLDSIPAAVVELLYHRCSGDDDEMSDDGNDGDLRGVSRHFEPLFPPFRDSFPANYTTDSILLNPTSASTTHQLHLSPLPTPNRDT